MSKSKNIIWFSDGTCAIRCRHLASKQGVPPCIRDLCRSHRFNTTSLNDWVRLTKEETILAKMCINQYQYFSGLGAAERNAEKMISYRRLQDTQMAPGIPVANQRGGLFESPWVEPMFEAMPGPTLPNSSPRTAEVPHRIALRPVSFEKNMMQPVQLTGFGLYGRPLPVPVANMSQLLHARNSGIFESNDVRELGILVPATPTTRFGSPAR